MTHLSHKSLILIAGIAWLGMGLYLMPLGLRYLESCLTNPGYTPLITSLQSLVSNPDYAVVLIIAIALAVGQMKGRVILAKAANREISRIRSLPNPSPLQHIFSSRFYMLMAIMMSLGIGMTLLAVPLDIRGFIDTIVGVALIQGSIIYLRASREPAAAHL